MNFYLFSEEPWGMRDALKLGMKLCWEEESQIDEKKKI